MKKTISIGLLGGAISFIIEIFFAFQFGMGFYFTPPIILTLALILITNETKMEKCLLISLITYVSRNVVLNAFAYSFAYYLNEPITITVTELFDGIIVILGLIIVFLVAYIGQKINEGRK